MEKSAIEQSTEIAERVREKAQNQATLDSRASAEILDKATATVKTVRSIWTNAMMDAVQKIGDTPENRKIIYEAFSELQMHHINAVYNGVQFIDMYNYQFLILD